MLDACTLPARLPACLKAGRLPACPRGILHCEAAPVPYVCLLLSPPLPVEQTHAPAPPAGRPGNEYVELGFNVASILDGGAGPLAGPQPDAAAAKKQQQREEEGVGRNNGSGSGNSLGGTFSSGTTTSDGFEGTVSIQASVLAARTCCCTLLLLHAAAAARCCRRRRLLLAAGFYASPSWRQALGAATMGTHSLLNTAQYPCRCLLYCLLYCLAAGPASDAVLRHGNLGQGHQARGV